VTAGGIPFVEGGGCQAGVYFGVRHAPFRRATRVAALTAARSLVSITGRAGLPLNLERGGRMVIVDSARLIVGGVDTHRDSNVAAVVDMNGGLLGMESFPTTADGHRCLSLWMSGFGTIERVGIEGTGAYGAGLARHFGVAGVVVIEVDRPNRQKRRQHGKSDRLDAIEAARGALSGRCEGRAKSGDGHAEALRALLVAKRSARSTRIRTIVQLRHLMFTAPDELRARLGELSATQLVNEAAKLRPRPGGDVAMQGVKTAAVILARRVHSLDVELAVIDNQMAPLVKAAAPELLNIYGVGVDTAAVLLVTAGDNTERITSEGAWAMLCGIAPIPATTGLIDHRFRLNNAGDRHANNAIWRIVITRLGQHEPRTIAYMQRRLAEGKSKRYIIRCLKRYIARETFRALPR
jgi:transposase